MKNKIFACALALVLALTTLASFVSCAAPKLDEVKDTFVSLIEESLEVNEILFGEGLSVYEPLDYDEASGTYYSVYTTKADGKLCAYYDNETKKYVVLEFGDEHQSGEIAYSDAERGIWLYKTELEFTDNAELLAGETPPTGYRYVRLDERCTSVNDISSMAYEVYSEDYLRDVFSMLIGDEGSLAISGELSAKYCETTVGYGNNVEKVLVRANADVVEPLVKEKRIYDYDSMVILRNSRRKFVAIEINSYGTYVDFETNTVKTGWSTVRLAFVKENGTWKLDSPTY